MGLTQGTKQREREQEEEHLLVHLEASWLEMRSLEREVKRIGEKSELSTTKRGCTTMDWREQLTGCQLLHSDNELHDIWDRSSYGQFHRRMRRWPYRGA
jgi:hypothetical protein